jgi:hypothetical protein
VKACYVGACRGCGTYTQPRNGEGDAYRYCKRCHPGAIQRIWTRESVIAAMLGRQARYGWILGGSVGVGTVVYALGIGASRTSRSLGSRSPSRLSRRRRCSRRLAPVRRRRLRAANRAGRGGVARRSSLSHPVETAARTRPRRLSPACQCRRLTSASDLTTTGGEARAAGLSGRRRRSGGSCLAAVAV